MVYAVMAQLAFSSAARRNAVLSDIQNRITGRARWDVDVLQAEAVRAGANGLRAELRFTANTDANDLSARVQSFAVGQNAPLPGSWLTVHDCTHDEGTNACTLVARRDW